MFTFSSRKVGIVKNYSTMGTVSEDSLASDEVPASLDVKTNEDLNCPLCLNRFRSPRQLPCTHSFCEACLQSHISKTVWEKRPCGEFHCPVCESKVRLPAEYSAEKWASMFPVSTSLLYMLLRENGKAERMCDACKSENRCIQSEGYCIDCNEAMCTDCIKFHRRQKISKDHNVINIEEFITTPESLIKSGSEFRCFVHAKETLTHTCKIHQVPLCTVCVKVNHKGCSSVTRLEEEGAQFLNQINLNQIKQTMKACEDEVTKLLAENVTNLNNLKSQAKKIVDQISDIRKKLNDVFDDIENKLHQCEEDLCQEELTKKHEKDITCQSLTVAMKNTHVLYKAMEKYGTDAQKYILAEKLKHHTSLLQKKINKIKTQKETLTLHLEINPKLKLMLAIPTRHFANLKVRRQVGEFIVSDDIKPLKGCNAKLVDTLTVRSLTWAINVVYVSQNIIIVQGQNFCLRCDLSSKLTTRYCFPESCNDAYASSICITGDNEVAVSFGTLREVYIFTVCDSKLSTNYKFKTRQMCSGIVAVSRKEIIVSGLCNDGKCFYWSLVTLYGEEKSYHEFNGDGKGDTYIAINSCKTLLYVSIKDGDSVYCFGLEGTVYYNITLTGLVQAAGIALDRDDSIYLLGKRNGNIFQISPDGEVIKVFKEDIPSKPTGICFNPTGDKFICLGEYRKEDRLFFGELINDFMLLTTFSAYLFELR